MSEKKSLEGIYKGSFFKRFRKLKWRIPIVCDAVVNVFDPFTLYDVGCGTGGYVQGLRQRGVDAFGIEGSTSAREYLDVREEFIFWKDVREPLNLGIEKVDMAMSLEVAEHIEPEYSDMYAKNLTELSNMILISAAPPGQGGHYHVNCQPPKYWIEKFGKLDYAYIPELVEDFKESLLKWKHRREVWVYAKNALVFRRV